MTENAWDFRNWKESCLTCKKHKGPRVQDRRWYESFLSENPSVIPAVRCGNQPHNIGASSQRHCDEYAPINPPVGGQ